MSLNSRTTEELFRDKWIYNEIVHIAVEIKELDGKIRETYANDLVIDRTLIAQINHLIQTLFDLVYDLAEDDPCRVELLRQYSKYSLFINQT